MKDKVNKDQSKSETDGSFSIRTFDIYDQALVCFLLTPSFQIRGRNMFFITKDIELGLRQRFFFKVKI